MMIGMAVVGSEPLKTSGLTAQMLPTLIKIKSYKIFVRLSVLMRFVNCYTMQTSPFFGEIRYY